MGGVGVWGEQRGGECLSYLADCHKKGAISIGIALHPVPKTLHSFQSTSCLRAIYSSLLECGHACEGGGEFGVH